MWSALSHKNAYMVLFNCMSHGAIRRLQLRYNSSAHENGFGQEVASPLSQEERGGCACTAGNIARPGKKLRSSKKT